MAVALVPSEVRKKRFEAWVAEFSDAVLRTCYAYLGERSLAEDALQETFFKVWRSMEAFEGRNGSSAKTWIIRIAINTCKDMRTSKKYRRMETAERAQFGGLPEFETSLQAREVFSAVRALPEKLRQAVILYYFQDLTQKEIANVLRVSDSAVQYRLRRAHEILQKQLKGSGAHEEG